MLNFSHILIKESPMNSPPFSEKMIFGASKMIDSHFIKTFDARFSHVVMAQGLIS